MSTNKPISNENPVYIIRNSSVGTSSAAEPNKFRKILHQTTLLLSLCPKIRGHQIQLIHLPLVHLLTPRASTHTKMFMNQI